MKEILVETIFDQTRVSVVEDGTLAEYYTDETGGEKLIGNIYMGRVENIVAGMQAAFVNIGMEKNAFLYAGDFETQKTDFGPQAEALRTQMANLSIQRLLKPGQELMVQITKIPGGTKGHRISSQITLPGRLCVLTPTVGYIGISRRIESEAERSRLRAIAETLELDTMGLIIRTAAEGATEEELAADAAMLIGLWKRLKERAQYQKAPCLVYADPGLVYTMIRDRLTEEIDAMRFDNREAYERACGDVEMLAPEMANRLSLHENDDFSRKYRLESQLDKAMRRQVWLKSGGFLVIDPTEALTVIDVNSGKFTGGKSLTETIFHINLEAAEEIAHQLRLRDIGGIVVIDFIDMKADAEKEALITHLKELLRHDHTHTNVSGVSALGLVEMTRRKVRKPLGSIYQKTCPRCQGSGSVVSDEVMAISVFGQLRRRLAAGESAALLAETSRAVMTRMLGKGYVLPGHAYVCPGDHADNDYKIMPADEGALPPDARPLRFN